MPRRPEKWSGAGTICHIVTIHNESLRLSGYAGTGDDDGLRMHGKHLIPFGVSVSNPGGINRLGIF